MAILNYIFCLIFLLIYNSAFTQRERSWVKVKGESEVLMSVDISKIQYEQTAYNNAVNKALSDEFGTSVIFNYEEFSGTEVGGEYIIDMYEKLIYDYTNSFPNGKWKKEIKKNCYEYEDDKEKWWMKCEVEGYAEEIKSSNVQFTATTLNGTDIEKDETLIFKDGEDCYLYFLTAEPGYLLVCYSDFESVSRCVPYNGMKDTKLIVEANRKYILFSAENADYIENKNIVDEIELQTFKEFEFNQFYVLFSPKEFNAPTFEIGSTDLKKGYTTFKSTTYKNFMNWLQNERILNNELQVNIIGINISK